MLNAQRSMFNFLVRNKGTFIYNNYMQKVKYLFSRLEEISKIEAR